MRVPPWVVCVFPWVIPQLHNDWSLCCDHGLDYASKCVKNNNNNNNNNHTKFPSKWAKLYSESALECHVVPVLAGPVRTERLEVTGGPSRTNEYTVYNSMDAANLKRTLHLPQNNNKIHLDSKRTPRRPNIRHSYLQCMNQVRTL